MSDRNNNCSSNFTGNAVNDNCQTNGFKEAVCIHTDKVYDSCREWDCAR